MFHIIDFCGDEGDMVLWAQLERKQHQDQRSEPCEDDCEVTAPYIDILPEETQHADPSPLRFFKQSEVNAEMRKIDEQIQQAMRVGW